MSSTAPSAKFGATSTPTPGASVERRADGVELLRRPAGRADDGVHAVPDAGQHVVERDVGHREDDGDVGVRDRRDVVAEVDPRAELEVAGRLDRLAHLAAHPAAGADHRRPDRKPVLTARRPRRCGRRRRGRRRPASAAARRARRRGRAPRSAVTARTAASVSSIDMKRAVDELGPAEPGHPGAAVLQAEHEPAADLALRPGQLVLADAVLGQLLQARPAAAGPPRRPCPARSRRTGRTSRSRSSRTRTSRPSRPARGARGSPGTAGCSCRRRAPR